MEACEILNIEYNTVVLILKALNRYGSTQDAAIELGMSERNIWKWRSKHKIVFNRDKENFEINLKAKNHEAGKIQ